jgi:hypothetical protein
MQKPAVEIRGSRVMRAAMASSAISARGRVMQHPGVDRGYSDDGMTCAGPSCAGIYEKDMDKDKRPKEDQRQRSLGRPCLWTRNSGSASGWW